MENYMYLCATIMTHPRNIKIADFAYELPEERIAKYPLAERDMSKLLVYDHGAITHHTFRHLPSLLPEGSLVVMNNTRVIQARLHFRKAAVAGEAQAPGALIEVFCLEPESPRDYVLMFQQRRSCRWHCLVGNSKKWKGGSLVRTIEVAGRSLVLTACREERHGGESVVAFSWDADDVTWGEVLEACGELPIPPYLNRATEESDKRTYQTVYSKVEGSVAAPTAGLHFTPRVLADMDARGIERAELTLHVGAGTFKPVKSEDIGGHEMHAEWIYVPCSVVGALLRHGGECTAVGTTSVRTLESLYYIGCRIIAHPTATEDDLRIEQWEPYGGIGGDVPPAAAAAPEPTAVEALQAIDAWMERNGLTALHTATRIIIAPGYRYHIVRRMVTNFHQPQSTLLLLVSAFLGADRWRQVYAYALGHDFRFLSYGDSSLLMP